MNENVGDRSTQQQIYGKQRALDEEKKRKEVERGRTGKKYREKKEKRKRGKMLREGEKGRKK